MKTIELSACPDALSADVRRKLSQRTLVDPTALYFVTGEDSWTQDGRENLEISPQLVISLIRSHSTNNKTDESPDASYINSDGKTVIGNPIIFGHLETKSIAWMGTDSEPIGVISASGRQMAKTSEWTTRFLAHARKLLQSSKSSNPVAHVTGQLLTEGGIPTHFSDAEWLIIFKGGSRIGKPLVTADYSAVCYLSVRADGLKPSVRKAYEESKRANIRLPSTFSIEANGLRRLVRSYVADDGFSEAAAVQHCRSTILNPIAVGSSAMPSEEYCIQLYKLSMLSPELQGAIDAEKDPVKALVLLERYTRKAFKGVSEVYTRDDGSTYSLSANKYDSRTQATKVAPPPKKERVASPPRESATAAQLTRLKAQYQTRPTPEVRVAICLLEYQAGNTAALDAFPHLAGALHVDSDEAVDLVIAALQEWDGSGLPIIDSKRKASMEATKIVGQLMDAMAGRNIKDRPAFARNWLAERISK